MNPTTNKPMNENSIERVAGYRVGQQIFTTVEEAQLQALAFIIDLSDKNVALTICRSILDHADEVIAILSEKPELKVRKRRSDYGAKHSKKNSAPAQRNTTPVPQA